MNAILIWIAFPILIAGLLFLLQSEKRLITLVGSGVSLTLAGMAWAFPVGTVIKLFSWNFEITGQFSVYGRQIIISSGDRIVIILLYILIAFWFIGSLATEVPSHFVPLGMVSAAVIVLGICIEPFFYAAILFEFVALLFVMLLSEVGHPPSKGVLRFLIFQTLGMLFILFGGWSLNQIDINIVDSEYLNRALILIGLGFSFLLGIFPFMTWLPMLSGENNIYLTAFMFNLFLNGAILFGIDFINQYAWINENFNLLGQLRVVGAIMLGVGGLWSMFQRNLGRMLGYAMTAEIGRSLLALSLGTQGMSMYFAVLFVQVCALSVWALSLNLLYSRTRNLDCSEMRGLARRLPFPFVGMLLAHFSLAGLPLLAGFPLYWSLGSQLTQQGSFWMAVWLLLGGSGLAIGGMRALSIFVSASENTPDLPVLKNLPRILLVLGVLALVIFGLFPYYLIHWGGNLTLAFQ